MNNDIEIPFTLNDPDRILAHRTEAVVAAYVIKAIVQAFQLPVAALIGSVIVTVTRTVMDIRFELNSIRLQQQIAVRIVAAQMINDALNRIAEDDGLRPQIRSALEDSLVALLEAELRRAQVS